MSDALSPDATDYFDYDLPESAIAQTPAEPRDSARLLVDRGDGVDHRRVSDLPDLLQEGDLLVVNDTRVLPARLRLVKPTGGAVEVLLVEPTGRPDEWLALVRPGKRVRDGAELLRPDDGQPVVRVEETCTGGRRRVTLLVDDLLASDGEVPLPPYITTALADPERYQTVFARTPGSVAAPTAGLHLTDEIISELARRNVGLARVELRVGLGTFRPVGTDVVTDHEMHAETYQVSAEAWAQIQAAKRVVAVGTTVVRTLESVAATGQLAGSTDLFIRRGYDWQVVDVLLTNFHVPRSSLLVLVDAFVGPRWRDLYREALDADYRFLSFGDAMLLTSSADRSVETSSVS